MTYPIIQRELTVHPHNKNWYLGPIEDEARIPRPVDDGWHLGNSSPDPFALGQQKMQQAAEK
jgi:hypothetical protein